MLLIEKRYAEALVSLAVQNNHLELFQQDLGAVTDIYKKQTDLKDFLLNPGTDIKTKKIVVSNIFYGKISSVLLDSLMFLLDKDRIKYLPGIFDEFVRLADEKRSMLNLTVISALPLDSEQLNKLKEKYRKLYKAASVKVLTELDTGLIGGIKVIIGDKLVDGTIKGRLKELQEILSKN